MEKEYPLQWPAGQPRTKSRDKGKFVRSLTDARVHLIKQVQMAGGSNILISSNYGGLSGKNPADPGIAIYFNRRGKRLAMACDRWSLIAHNLNALGNTVENLRGIDRWGCGHLMEQAFASYAALPPPAEGWRVVLGLVGIVPRPDDVERRYRELAKLCHPDTAGGGDIGRFQMITAARDAAHKEFKGESS